MVTTATNQRITGSGRADVLYDGDGDDTLLGRNGNDSLFAGLGDDLLNGGNGSDFLSGGMGNNTLIGGNGNDTFLIDAGLGGEVTASNVEEPGGPAFDTINDFQGAAIIKLVAAPIKPVKQFSDTLLIDNAQGKAVVLEQNGENVDLFIDGNLRATLLGTSAETVFGQTRFSDEEAPGSFTIGFPDDDENSPPEIEDDPYAVFVTEGRAAERDLTNRVSDPDGDELTFTLLSKAPPGFFFSTDGSGAFAIDASDLRYNHLNDGETEEFTVEYSADDGNGGVVFGTIAITVFGVTDVLDA